MRRTIRLATFVLTSSALVACSSPTAPAAAVCTRAEVVLGACVNKDYVNPAGDYVNPAGDYVNPAGDYVNPAGSYIKPAN
ncbi:MAG TPA: hypothetical protein VLE53_12455 [Gemmatimonadaceae bacterium]|nr:hypothetical protein [Gemmatimonadaceae bacterium]